ncbi:hypothetical protein [Bifidobacterium tibiigranuli]|jgi:hypothetical protein|nr:hypothetical protein [Bifidobacterium tibiigranuli]MCI1650197.1 hypothetical protein [Bifidobacterium tibiigranuli]MCI1673898.1 hypothetical protein [Bifidobacterium tibiigranuli]MCI1712147.1 hypothetical protein [Bifidobacterium tibiigranuli]MCI1834259.1 hypothetical protein [Bifidobacterium tibiigranuli]MCI2185753.1 hypothetical protein [Bifidobacterium tibiigranuli]
MILPFLKLPMVVGRNNGWLEMVVEQRYVIGLVHPAHKIGAGYDRF